MDEIIKFLSTPAGQTTLQGGIAGVVLLVYLFKVEPRLKSMEQTMLRGQKIDLLKIIKQSSKSSEATNAAENLLTEVVKDLDK